MGDVPHLTLLLWSPVGTWSQKQEMQVGLQDGWGPRLPLSAVLVGTPVVHGHDGHTTESVPLALSSGRGTAYLTRLLATEYLVIKKNPFSLVFWVK